MDFWKNPVKLYQSNNYTIIDLLMIPLLLLVIPLLYYFNNFQAGLWTPPNRPYLETTITPILFLFYERGLAVALHDPMPSSAGARTHRSHRNTQASKAFRKCQPMQRKRAGVRVPHMQPSTLHLQLPTYLIQISIL